MKPFSRRSARCAGFLLIISAFLLLPGPARSETTAQVLILHAYHRAAWTESLMQGFASVFDVDPGISLSVEYMDTKRLNTEVYLQLLHDTYRLKYQSVRFDVIITSDDNAFLFALNHQKEVFHEAPIVFCGVNRFTDDLLLGHSNVTGVLEKGDFKDTLAVAMRMRPWTKSIFVICDTTTTGRINKANFQKVIRDQYPNVHVTSSEDQTREGLGKTLASLPPDAYAFFISFWQDVRGEAVSPEDLEILFKKSAVPVFGRSEWMMGKGMTGGKCVSGFHQGEAAAQMAKRILEGVDPATIPVIRDSPNKFMFDYLELKKHSIPADTVPQGSILFNKPKAIYEIHKDKVILAAVCIVLLLLVLVVLIANILQRKHAEAALGEREEHLKEIMNSLQAGVILIDEQSCQVVDANPVAADLIGLPKEKIIGRPYREFALSQEEEGCSILKGDQSVNRSEGVLLNAKQEHVPVLKSVARIEIGGRRHYLETVMDISERKTVEKNMRYFQMAVESASDAVGFSTPQGVHFYQNKAFDELFGDIGEDPPGSLFVDEATGRQVFRTIMAGGQWRGELQMYSKSKAVLDIFLRAYAIKDQKDVVIGLVGIHTDITNQKQAQRERKQLEAKLAQAQRMEAIGTLAGGIAHDFNNILSAIMGYTELAELDTPDASPAKSNLKQVLQASRRAKSVVNQILAYSRQTEPADSPIKIGPVIEEGLQLLRASIPTSIEIRQEIVDVSGAVMIDPSQIQQVVMNLCTNASHAMLHTGGILDVRLDEVDLTRQNGTAPIDLSPGIYARLTVGDTGSGIAPEIMDRIFDPYFTTKEKGVGTGLGLSVVVGIVNNYGGTITVDSKSGRGTTFHVYLPVADVAAVEKSVGDESFPIGEGHVLLVDDEEMLVRLEGQMIERMGYTVSKRTDSIEALEAFKENPGRFDLVITDQTMPNMTGERLAKEIMGIRPDIPVILCTGYSHIVDQSKSQQLGIRAFIMKPIVMKDLAETIQKVLA